MHGHSVRPGGPAQDTPKWDQCPQGLCKGLCGGLCGGCAGILEAWAHLGRLAVAMLPFLVDFTLSDCKAQRFMLFGKMLDFTMDSYNY